MAENENDSSGKSEQPIIIKKIKKGGHGHHGGAWKVAYADFVTAMMAFFIVMWIFASNESVKDAVADYFNAPENYSAFTGKKTAPVELFDIPSAASKDGSSDGASSDGASSDGASSGAPSEGASSGAPSEGASSGAPSSGASSGAPSSGASSGASSSGASSGAPSSGANTGAPSEGASSGAASKKPFTWSFEGDKDKSKDKAKGKDTVVISETVANAIKDSINAAKQVANTGSEIKKGLDKMLQEAKTQDEKNMLSSIKIEITPEGMRIELLETIDNTFFEVGSARVKPEAVKILKQIAAWLGRLGNCVEIEGHTDSRGYANKSGYGNWELSADRANAARKVLDANGLWSGQVVSVSGYADRRLRNPSNPFDKSNRRISILARNLSPADFIKIKNSNTVE